MSFRPALLAVAAALGATSASAKLPDPSAAFPKAETLDVMHVPTGCLARIEVINGASLVTAAIVDPKCLPSGVRSRAVPGTMIDFAPLTTLR